MVNRDPGDCTTGVLTRSRQCSTQSCTYGASELQSSDPIKVESRDDAVIENLYINTNGSEPGISVIDSSNVIIRNVHIVHTGAQQCRPWQDCAKTMPVVAEAGVGLSFKNCPNITIQQVKIELKRVSNPHANGTINAKCGDTYCGPFPITMAFSYNMEGHNSPFATIKDVSLKGGSSGLWTKNCSDILISHVKVENVHGPYPRGQCFQLARSERTTIEDFYCHVDNDIGYTEDAISIWETTQAIIRRGLIDGGNAPTGVGVMFERGHHGICEDVDITHHGKGAFSNYGSDDVKFLRTRARDNHALYPSCKTGRGYCTDFTGHNFCEGVLDGFELAGGNLRDDSGGGLWYSGDYNSNIGDGSYTAQANGTAILQGQFWNIQGFDPNTDTCVHVQVDSWQTAGATRPISYTAKETVEEDFVLRTPYNPVFDSSWTYSS